MSCLIAGGYMETYGNQNRSALTWADPKEDPGSNWDPPTSLAFENGMKCPKKKQIHLISEFSPGIPKSRYVRYVFFGMGMPCTQISGHAFLADPCWLQVPFSRTSSGCIKKSALWPKTNVMSLSCGLCQPK